MAKGLRFNAFKAMAKDKENRVDGLGKDTF